MRVDSIPPISVSRPNKHPCPGQGCGFELSTVAIRMTHDSVNIFFKLLLKFFFKFCILEQIIATVLFICISSINNKRSLLRFQSTTAPTNRGWSACVATFWAMSLVGIYPGRACENGVFFRVIYRNLALLLLRILLLAFIVLLQNKHTSLAENGENLISAHPALSRSKNLILKRPGRLIE